MKKLLLTFVLFAAVSFAAQAQRSINWSTDSVAGIDTVYSSDSGTPFSVTFVMKNNGTDTVFPGDTVLFQFVAVAGSQAVFAYPSTNSLSIKRVTDTIVSGDTLMHSVSFNVPLKFNTSASISFGIISHVVNRPNLPFEVAPGNANNSLTKTIIWKNPQGWPVGFAEELADAAKSLSVYPNPSSSVVNFDIDYNKAAKVAIMDITGRMVEEVNFEFNKAQVNVSNYNKGIYLYQVTDVEGHIIKSGKVSVN